MEWCYNAENDSVFRTLKDRILHTPILVLPDPYRSFSVVCDASESFVGGTLL